MSNPPVIFQKRSKFLRGVVKHSGLLIISIVWLTPLVMAILLSLRPENDPLGVGTPFFGRGISLDNFRAALEIAPWAQYYANTFIFVFGVLIVQLFTITIAAYAFAKMNFFGRDVLFTLLLVQFMLPGEALLIPNFSTIHSLGLYDTKLALMLPYFGSAFGTFVIRQAFRQIPQDLEDAAKIDGCGFLGVLRHVYIPGSIAAYTAFSIASLSSHWNEFLWPLIITKSHSTRVLTIALMQVAQTSETGANYTHIAAGVLIVAIPLLFLFAIFQRQFINSFLRSGLR